MKKPQTYPIKNGFKSLTIAFLLICSTYGSKLSAQVVALGTEAKASATNTLLNFTAPAGSNRLLIVTASDAGSDNITSVKFNGTNMTEAKKVTDGFAVDAIYILTLGTSASSTTGSIIITSSNASHINKVITARVFEKVNQTTPLSNILSAQNVTVPSASSLNITSSTGDLVFDLFDSWKSTGTGSPHSAGSGQAITTSISALPLSLGFGWWTTSTKAGANSVTMSRSTTDHGALIHIAVNIKNDNVVLPINLKSLNVSLINNQPKLVWVTASETNFDHFEIEKSSDGKVFYSIVKVLSKNNNNGSNYQYTDLEEKFGQQYYRLKIIDKDGTFNYSAIITLKTATSETISLSLFPNPAVNSITVNHPKANSGSVIKILSLDGKIIKSNFINDGELQTNIQIENLVKSTYLVVFENSGQVLSSKFVKQ